MQNSAERPTTPTIGDNNPDLSSDEIKILTSQLSQEIDEEIRKQFAQNQVVEQTQEKINEIIKKNTEVNPKVLTEKPSPINPAPKTESKLENLGPTQSNENEPTMRFDPLRSSVDSALLNLKDGDNVSKDWVLLKIRTTSFGNNKSLFYELQNKAGALWTLSPEEMKEVLQSEIIAKNNSHEPLPNLAPEDTGAQIKPNASSEKTKNTSDENKIIDKSEVTEKAMEAEKILFQSEKESVASKNIELTKQQVELVTKLHSDKNLWGTFISFSPNLWNKVYQLYETGKLTDIGIEAHPLLDKLESSDFDSSVQIEKGTSISKLLESNGCDLKGSAEDSLVLGCHILANYEVLRETIKKVETSGIAVSPLQSKKEIIKVITQASSGDKNALQILQADLHFLPVNSKFKLIKPQDLESLSKFI